MKGKLIIYGLGGAGINIINDIAGELSNLGDDFSDIEFRLLDTTEKTIQNYPELKSNFYKIDSTLSSNPALDGMAGERKSIDMVNEITKAVKKYVDNNVKEDKVNEYHILIASASGGSGSLILPILYSEFRQKDITAIPIVIGDSSTLLHVTNSINTIVGLNKIAKLTKTAGAVVYFDNTGDNTITTPQQEKQINQEILKLLTVVSMYTSGRVHDIDHQDMRNFFIPSRYKSFTVMHGLYTLAGKIKVLEDKNAIIARTILANREQDIDVKVPLLHQKIGVASEGHLTKLTPEIFPMYLILQKEVLNNTVLGLQEKHKQLENIKKVESSALDALEDSLESDDGLIL